MTATTESGVPGASAIDTVWTELQAESNERLLRTLKATTLRYVDELCKRHINAGEYDSSAKLSDVFEWFEDEHLADDSELVRTVFRADEVQPYVVEYGRESMGRVVFRRVVETLEADDELLYVYDRQRVRSRVAEMARYFALIRQRLDSDTDFGFTPNLVKMVKLDIVDREQPIVDGDAAVSFPDTLRQINRDITGDVSPSPELQATMGDDWKTTVKESVAEFRDFLSDGLPEEFDQLAAYQKRAFVEVYTHAVTDRDLDEELGHVITASTGGGKTEAFLFPVLLYCLTAWKAGLEGNRAVLTYPRRDLCDNQFERLFDYVHTLNQQLGHASASFEEAPISIALQHGNRNYVELDCPQCEGMLTPPDREEGGKRDGCLSCSNHDDHRYEWATTDRSDAADIIVMTQNSLHLRMMDRHGEEAFWSQQYPTKFLVLDEVHVYTEQAGMHVANVVRRFKRAVEELAPGQQPSLVASSATIHDAENFTERIFDVEDAVEISPEDDEMDTVGSEYIIFVKATEPRDVTVPVGDSVFKPQEKWDDVEQTTASNLSCMIQIAYGFWHTARKERGGTGTDGTDKDKILGFVDSIDSVGRLGSSVEDAEQNRHLFDFRRPDAFLRGEGSNPDCHEETFTAGADDTFDERAVCEHLAPNPYLNECPTYEAGECWWTMDQPFELRPMQMAIQKSGTRQRPTEAKNPGEDWDQLIATSTLEVGFDNESIIGTFQYRAPMSVPSFLQRKGRGGRDAEDRPVTVVVLGSTSTDSYYFHHSDYLSDPREEHLEIPLDEENRFIRSEHMVAAIFDYFNLREGVDARGIYEGNWPDYGPDVDELRTELDAREGDLQNWLATAFDVDADEAATAVERLQAYAESLEEPVAPGVEETPFWEFFRDAVEEAGASGSYGPLDDLVTQLRGAQDE
jgi:hypothetical protein